MYEILSYLHEQLFTFLWNLKVTKARVPKQNSSKNDS